MNYEIQQIIYNVELPSPQSFTIDLFPVLDATGTEFLPESKYTIKISKTGVVTGGADGEGGLPVKPDGTTTRWDFEMPGAKRKTVGHFFLAKSNEVQYFAELLIAGGAVTDSVKTYVDSRLQSKFGTDTIIEAVAVSASDKLGVVQSDVIVSGAGTEEANGVYTYRGEYNGKPFYNKESQPTNLFVSSIYWQGGQWGIAKTDEDNAYISLEDVEFPFQISSWQTDTGELPAPTVTERKNLKTVTKDVLRGYKVFAASFSADSNGLSYEIRKNELGNITLNTNGVGRFRIISGGGVFTEGKTDVIYKPNIVGCGRFSISDTSTIVLENYNLSGEPQDFEFQNSSVEIRVYN